MSVKTIKSRKKRAEQTLVVEQWIEVEVNDGVTTTTRYPDDEEVKKLIEQKAEDTGR